MGRSSAKLSFSAILICCINSPSTKAEEFKGKTVSTVKSNEKNVEDEPFITLQFQKNWEKKVGKKIKQISDRTSDKIIPIQKYNKPHKPFSKIQKSKKLYPQEEVLQ